MKNCAKMFLLHLNIYNLKAIKKVSPQKYNFSNLIYIYRKNNIAIERFPILNRIALFVSSWKVNALCLKFSAEIFDELNSHNKKKSIMLLKLCKRLPYRNINLDVFKSSLIINLGFRCFNVSLLRNFNHVYL